MNAISLHENVVVEETTDPTLAAMRVIRLGDVYVVEHDDLPDLLEAYGF